MLGAGSRTPGLQTVELLQPPEILSFDAEITSYHPFLPLSDLPPFV